jgi:hypothetical protein
VTPFTDQPGLQRTLPGALPGGLVIVSAGLVSAGSGWYYNLTNDLLIAAGGQDSRHLRHTFELTRILAKQNCRIDSFDAKRLKPLDAVVAAGHAIAVKTHQKPTPALRAMIASGRAKATYILRDPRDALVSALDRGRQRRARGKTDSFARLSSFAVGLAWMRFHQMPRYEAWRATPGTLFVRYEDLRADPVAEMKRLAAFLRLIVPTSAMQHIADKYRGEHARLQTGSHYRTGGTGGTGNSSDRRRDQLSPRQLALATRILRRHLAAMDYPP